jgi:predicted nucleotidyltransferase component of viral defense system
MSTDPRVTASVRTRLVALAHERGEEAGLVFTRYALERFLYRLGRSVHRDSFVLKGAMLLRALDNGFRRSTKDLDLLGFGASDAERVTTCIRACCALEVEDDGLDFDTTALVCAPIREELEYGGVRATFVARLGSAALRMQIDVGFGDAVTPAPEDLLYPTLLAQPQPNVRAYPVVTVVAEKLHAITVLGMANTRLKDYYDLYCIAQTFALQPDELRVALERTFERRATPLPTELPLGLSEAFALNPTKVAQWQGFLKRNGIDSSELSLERVVAQIRPWMER